MDIPRSYIYVLVRIYNMLTLRLSDWHDKESCSCWTWHSRVCIMLA